MKTYIVMASLALIALATVAYADQTESYITTEGTDTITITAQLTPEWVDHPPTYLLPTEPDPEMTWWGLRLYVIPTNGVGVDICDYSWETDSIIRMDYGLDCTLEFERGDTWTVSGEFPASESGEYAVVLSLLEVYESNGLKESQVQTTITVQ